MSIMAEQNKLALDFTKFFHDLGMLLLIDDIQDIGKFTFEGHPSPIHHWQIGWLMKEVALYVGQGLSWLQAWDEAGKEMVSNIMEPTLKTFESMVEQQKHTYENLLNSFTFLYKQ